MSLDKGKGKAGNKRANSNNSENKTDSQTIRAAERRVKVLELRKGGASFRAIASRLRMEGILCSHETVRKDIQISMKKLSEQELKLAEQLRALELARIDSLWHTHWFKGLAGDIASGWILLGLSKRRCELIPEMIQSKRGINLKLTKEELEKMSDDELDELIKQLE